MQFTNILGFAAAATASTVLAPLYFWPGAGAPTNWQPLITAAQANPDVFFTAIINPDSGPGAADFPDTDYIPSVAKLNSLGNIRVIGYVHTSYGQQDIDVLNANVTKYSNWNAYATTPGNMNTSIAGIFFDEVEYRNPSNVTYIGNAASHARSVLATAAVPTPFIVYNPGTKELPQYFTSNVDLIIQSEINFTTYQSTNPIASFDAGTIPESAIVINLATDATAVQSATEAAVEQGIGGVYFSADAGYNSIDPNILNAVVEGVKAAQA